MISICINSYNYARFLPAAIDSALALASEADVEVVVVDDGSTDDSRAVIEAYGDEVVAVFTENGGQGSAFNAGFERARGDIVVFLDADDELVPGLASALVDAFAAAPRPAKVHSGMVVIDEGGRPTGDHIAATPPARDPVALRDHVRRFRSYPWPPSSAMAYDAAALREVMPLPAQEYRTACDAYLAELLPYVGGITCLPQDGARYRSHGANGYRGTAIDPEWLRWKIALVVDNHHRAVALADRLGVPGPPADPLAPLDAALLGYRVASLALEPEEHPIPSDRRAQVGWTGVRAVLANPSLGGRERAIRAPWFLLVGFLPRPAAARVARRFIPDTPLRLRPRWLPRPS